MNAVWVGPLKGVMWTFQILDGYESLQHMLMSNNTMKINVQLVENVDIKLNSRDSCLLLANQPAWLEEKFIVRLVTITICINHTAQMKICGV